MITISLKIILLALFLLSSTSTLAHHSFAADFKADEFNTIEGLVTDFRLRNPHVLIYLDVSNEDGSVTNWMVVGNSAIGWRQAGWDNDSLKSGDMLRVTGSATHDGSPMVSNDEMYMLNPSNGTVLAELDSGEDPEVSLGNVAATKAGATQLTFLPATLPTGEPNFTGTTSRTEGMRGGPDVNDAAMPYNAVGEAANISDVWALVNDPQVFCDPPGLVRQAGYTPYGHIIKQYPDHVTIEYEEFGSRRSIFFGDKLPKPGVASHLGDSVARYEGDTLVVETVNLLPNLSGHRGKPLSGQTRVVEVYSREDHPESGTILVTETTVHDPVYLTEPWTISRTKTFTAGYEFIENECAAPLRERPANVWQQTQW
jgi:hypothetical protein